ALNELHYTTGQAIPALGTTGAFNYIHVDTPVATAGLTQAGAFINALAGAGIAVTARHDYLLSFYDSQNSQAVFVAVDSGAGALPTFIDATDFPGAATVALVGMSVTDYQNLGPNNIKFVGTV